MTWSLIVLGRLQPARMLLGSLHQETCLAQRPREPFSRVNNMGKSHSSTSEAHKPTHSLPPVAPTYSSISHTGPMVSSSPMQRLERPHRELDQECRFPHPYRKPDSHPAGHDLTHDTRGFTPKWRWHHQQPRSPDRAAKDRFLSKEGGVKIW